MLYQRLIWGKEAHPQKRTEHTFGKGKKKKKN